MNKKLFFAGFALLAAVSFTSCNSDNPIDVTNPNGVTPAAATHYLGGEYDWTAIAKDYTQLKEFWAADKKDVKDAIKDKKTINILLDVSGYELKNELIALPDFWQDGATNGKVVNITFQGNFKKADFERADAIKKNGAALEKFPVKISTDLLPGAEVNLTFDAEKFDLVLASTKTRTSLYGDFTIGYMKADVPTKGLSAFEVKEGTVEGLDVESTGIFKGTYDALWTKSAGNDLAVEKTGLVLTTDGNITKTGTISGVKNLYVEKSANLDTRYVDNGAKTYQLGTVKFVNKDDAATTLDINNQATIDEIIGVKNTVCTIVGAGSSAKLIQGIGSIEKCTVTNAGNEIALKSDVYTDVIFADPASFSTKDVNTFDKVEFNALSMTIPEDNQTVTFNAVNFKAIPTLSSGIIYSETASSDTKTYQWIINGAGVGEYQLVDNNNPITEANKGVEPKSYTNAHVVPTGGAGSASTNFAKFDWVNNNDADKAAAAEANSSFVVKITYVTTTTPVEFIPDGTNIVLDKDCKFLDWDNYATPKLAQTDYALNLIWGNKDYFDEECWYNVNYAGSDYDWKKVSDPTAPTGVMFVLKKAAAAE